MRSQLDRTARLARWRASDRARCWGGGARPPGIPEQEKSDRVQEGSTTMRVITREEIVAEVTETARRAGLTFEEFMDEGKSDMLTDAACRDIWLLYRDVLLKR